jgi:hypothetical protein
MQSSDSKKNNVDVIIENALNIVSIAMGDTFKDDIK